MGELGSFSTSLHIAVYIKIETQEWLEKLQRVEELCHVAARLAVLEGGAHQLAPSETDIELTIVLTDDVVVQTLNRVYRGEDKPTNVLSFALLEKQDFLIPGEGLALGDIVIALQTTLREASEQSIPLTDYFCHLVVHGALHLLGYDHQENGAAEAMERLEDRVLALLGVENPYDTDVSTILES